MRIELQELMKNKAEIEDIDSLSNLINELYDKIHEVEKNGGSGTGLSVTEKPALMSRSSVGSQSRAGAQTVKEINEIIKVLKETVDTMGT